MNSFAQFQPARSRTATCLLFCAISLAFGVVAGSAQAQTSAPASLIYPAKGQSAKQQDQDKYECYDWSKGQSGFDPTQVAQSTPASQPKQSGGTAGGMIVGAAGGAAVAELTHHDAGRGAAAGALGGGALARMKERQTAQGQQQQAAQQQAVRGQQRATYDRAFGACMEARGYVVK